MRPLALLLLLSSTALSSDILPYIGDLVYRWAEVEQPKTKRSISLGLADKIEKIRIKEYKTENYTISEAAQLISLLSRFPDPHQIGISMIVKDDNKTKLPQNITLSMENASVEAILKRVCEISGYTYKVEEYAVFLLPLK
ncbi:MAG: hypothetical protein HC904_16490 [Blastochloris sp.]|nr:hypothetical protein [Blastochloris sp.]